MATAVESTAEPGAARHHWDNKEIVTPAIEELFNQHDLTGVDRYWRDPYTQHNPTMPNGLQTLRDLLSEAVDIHYEMHAVLADGDLIVLHGRVTGWGPKPVIVEDIFRVDRGKIVEHWDVVHDEVSASETFSGNPMV
ncbi:nuclear transport factor 2 family protein [Streptomyces mirabilis]|uniref:nuclear transport factor 2 family protein n=1 Tax=Streptomyces mirabilis TaxID=68239 RepID=UPI00365556A0